MMLPLLLAATLQSLWPNLDSMPDKAADHTMPQLEWSETPANQPANGTGSCVILLPNGYTGYNAASEREALRPYEEKLLAKGVTCVWLWYRTPAPAGAAAYKVAWDDGQRAIRLVRQAAAEKGYSADKIGVAGTFSGAHLAVLLGSSSQTAAYAKVDATDDVSCRPNFAIPMSPTGVLTSETGTDLDPAFTFGKEEVCPMCLFHGAQDSVASPIGTTRIYRKCRGHKDMTGADPAPSEVHIYPDLAHEYISADRFDRATEFMCQMGFLGAVPAIETLLNHYPTECQASTIKVEPVWPSGKTPNVNAQQETPWICWHFPQTRTTDAIMMLHAGGGYNHNVTENSETISLRRYLNEKGMTVVTFHYRTPNAESYEGRSIGIPRTQKYLRPWQDLQRAIRLVRRDAPKYGLDPQNIGISGGSAGGHLALLGAVSSETAAYSRIDEVDDIPCNVQWSVPYYAAYVLTDGWDAPNNAAGGSFGNPDSATIMTEFKFDNAMCPVLFLHGDLDGYSAMGSVKSWEAMRAKGVIGEIHTYAKAPHNFPSVNYIPGTGSASTFDVIWDFAQRTVPGHQETPSIGEGIQPSGQAYCGTDAKSIQAAIDAAVPNGTVTLGEGTFYLAADLSVTGGVKLVGQGWEKTILQRTTADAVAKKSYRLVDVDGGAKVEGVTLTGGKIADAGVGGAVRIADGTVSYCCITNNRGSANSICGVGVSFKNGKGTLDHSIVVDNKVANDTAIAIPNLLGVAVGIMDTTGPVNLDTCLVYDNGVFGNASGLGGIYLQNVNAECVIRNCTITRNRSSSNAGGIAFYHGSVGAKRTVLVNNILAGNFKSTSADTEGNLYSGYSNIDPTKSSNCFFGLSGEISFNAGSMTTMASSLSGDPLFVDAANGDFRLQQGSPAIGAGAARGDAGKDLIGRGFNVSTPAMGCYEATPVAPPHDHAWGTPVYQWSDDGTSCTAIAPCTVTDCGETFTESAKITPEVTKPATAEAAGTCVYTATFTSDLFTTQTKTVEIPKIHIHSWNTPTYTWQKTSEGYDCKASSVCAENALHVTNETVHTAYEVTLEPTETTTGTGVYTAVFASELFTTQTKEVKLPKTSPDAPHEDPEDAVKASGDTTGATDAGTIQSLIDDAPTGGIVELGSGTFYLNTELFVTNGVTLVGQGCQYTTLRAASDKNIRIATVNEGATLKGVNVTGSRVTTMSVPGAVWIKNGTVSWCRIAENTAGAHDIRGVGVSFSAGKGTLDHCVVEANEASGLQSIFGCGVCAFDTLGPVLIDSCLIVDNLISGGSGAGAGLATKHLGADCTVRNCTIVGNAAPQGGAGVTVAINTDSTMTGKLVMVNDILVGNTDNKNSVESNFSLNAGGKFDYENSKNCFFGKASEISGTASGQPYTLADCLSGDPVFEDADNGDYRLQDASTAKGAGVSYSGLGKDLDNKNYANPPSMGCYEAGEAAPEHDHEWGEATYKWSTDFSTCAASVSCTVAGCSETLSEQVTASYTVTREATVDETGTGVYTAVFASELFETQTHEVTLPKIVPPHEHVWGTPSYVWSTDNAGCTASAACTAGDCTETTNETVTAAYEVVTPATETSVGLGRYTATFACTLFATQTKDVEIPVKTACIEPGASAAATTKAIQDAIDAAAAESTPGTVTLGEGVFQIDAQLNVTGGVTLVGQGQAKTFIEPESGASIRCVFVDGEATVEGLTLRNGKINDNGGGVSLVSGTVRDCCISNCQTITGQRWGGGVYMTGGTVEDCLIVDCKITSGHYQWGGGGICMEDGQVVRCEITGCQTAGTYGHANALFMKGGVADGCDIHHNDGGNDGNIAFNSSVVLLYKDGTLQNSKIHDNTRGNMAGVRIMDSGRVSNCLIYGNKAPNKYYSDGCGLYMNGGTAEYCTVYGNSLVENKAHAGLNCLGGTVKNSIFWGNGGEGWTGGSATVSGSPTIANNVFDIVPDGYASGNVAGDPLFTNAASGDFTISSDASPACGYAVPIVGVTTDILGATRSATAPTCGAYEFGAVPPTPEWDIPGTTGGINGIDDGKGGKCINITSISIVDGKLTVGFEAGKVDADGETFGLICKEKLTDTETFILNVTLTNGATDALGVLAGTTDKSSLFILGIGPDN